MSGGMSFNLGAKKGPKLAFGLKGQTKAHKPAGVFEADSEDEEQLSGPEPKRQRRRFQEEPDASSTGLVSENMSEEEQRTADKLADFVAKNGRSFEEVTRQRNSKEGIFKWLFDTTSAGYKYYELKLEQLSSNSQKPGSLASNTRPPAAVPQTVNSTRPVLSAPRLAPNIVVPPASTILRSESGAGASSVSKADSKRSGAADDSLAAMEAFTKLAAQRDAQRGQDQEAALPHLNETSFDRRRSVAVYKGDGSRGHHMQDYIPKEELAKFLSKSSNEEAKAQAEAIERATRIQSDNIGHKLLSQMGWKEGEGLGAQGTGQAAPVASILDAGSDKRGLGAEDVSAIQEGDDEFEAYRKRMMLGYKHRPNPLGNPRKSYY